MLTTRSAHLLSLAIRPDSPYLLCCCGRSPLLTQQRVCFTFPAEAGTHLELLGREDAMGIKCLAQGQRMDGRLRARTHDP